MVKKAEYHPRYGRDTEWITVEWQSYQEPGLLSTSKAICGEATSIYYHENKFEIVLEDFDHDTVSHWMKKLKTLSLDKFNIQHSLDIIMHDHDWIKFERWAQIVNAADYAEAVTDMKVFSGGNTAINGYQSVFMLASLTTMIRSRFDKYLQFQREILSRWFYKGVEKWAYGDTDIYYQYDHKEWKYVDFEAVQFGDANYSRIAEAMGRSRIEGGGVCLLRGSQRLHGCQDRWARKQRKQEGYLLALGINWQHGCQVHTSVKGHRFEGTVTEEVDSLLVG
jgi:hypothetical protein